MIYIYPYKLASKSAKDLRKGLSSLLGYKVKLVTPDGNFKPRRDDIVINWGNSQKHNWKANPNDLNFYELVATASNKLESFKLFKENNIPIPEWTTNKEEAKKWKGDIVVRTILNSHSGRGIVLCNSETIIDAPLYVKYKKKKEEYRVHVFKGKVIDVQQKRKRTDYEGHDTKIRNHHTGWVYTRENVRIDDALKTIASQAIQALHLDFGAVDIIYNEHENQYYVLEVNTAPGLEGTTLNNYVKELVNV